MLTLVLSHVDAIFYSEIKKNIKLVKLLQFYSLLQLYNLEAKKHLIIRNSSGM